MIERVPAFNPVQVAPVDPLREEFVQQKAKGLRAGLRKRPKDMCPDFGKIILMAVPNNPVVDRVWKYLESVI